MKGFKRVFLVAMAIILVAGTALPSTISYGAPTKKLVINYKNLKLNTKNLALREGNKTTLKVSTNRTGKKATWSSSKKSVATVNKNGRITARSAGKTTITVKSGNYKAKCKVTVKKLIVNSKRLKLKKKTLTLKQGNKTTLKVSTNKSGKKATWSSSKKSVATVNKNGRITAKSAGKTTITVTSGSYKATCRVTVKKVTKTTNSGNTTSSNKTSTFENEVSSNISTYNRMIKDVVKYTNQYRVAHGKSKVKLDTQLTYIASYRSLEMANIDNLSHTRPNGTTVGSLARGYNIDYQILGENIGCYQPTSKIIVDGWYNSPSHKDNMLSDRYSKIGIGVGMTSDGYYYWTQLFTN